MTSGRPPAFRPHSDAALAGTTLATVRGRTAVHAGPTALAVKEARAAWLDTPVWLKRCLDGRRMYQSEFPDDPDERRVDLDECL
jgi:hypothetical protein